MFCLPENTFKRCAQRGVRVVQRYRKPKIDKACDAEFRRADSARRDAGEVFEIRFHVEGYAVKTNPLAQAHADRRDLILALPARPFAFDPYADAALAHLAAHIEFAERADDPAFEIGDEACDVATARA